MNQSVLLLTLADDDELAIKGSSWVNDEVHVLYPVAVNVDGTVVDVFTGLALGAFDLSIDQKVYQVLLLASGISTWRLGQGSFHLLSRQFLNVTREQSVSNGLRFCQASFAVHELGYFFSQLLLR